jgi:hypothetical protein
MRPGTARALASICATTWPDGENVDHPFGIPTIEDHSPLTYTQPPQALGTAQQLDVPSGSVPIAALIRSRSRRPSRRRDFNAAGRTSIRHPRGSASAQLCLGLRPRDTGLAPRLPDGLQILLADFLVVIRRRVELGDHRVLSTAKQDRSRGQRLVRKGIHQLVQLGLGHTRNRSSSGHLNDDRISWCDRTPLPRTKSSVLKPHPDNPTLPGTTDLRNVC